MSLVRFEFYKCHEEEVAENWGGEKPLMRATRGLDTWTLAGFIDSDMGTNEPGLRQPKLNDKSEA